MKALLQIAIVTSLFGLACATRTAPPPAPAAPPEPVAAAPMEAPAATAPVAPVAAETPASAFTVRSSTTAAQRVESGALAGHDAPTAVVAVYYNIGFRTSSATRTGLRPPLRAHDVQGSGNLGKRSSSSSCRANGGVLRIDAVRTSPTTSRSFRRTRSKRCSGRRRTRMRGLAITQENLTNQKGVVKNEVRVTTS